MSVRRNMAWVGASQAIFFVLQFASSVVVARLLSPYETGIYAVALAIVGVLSTIQAFGLTAFIVREAELDADTIASVFTANAILGLLLSALIGSTSVLGGALLREDGVRRVMLYLAILPILDIFQFLPSARFEREGNFRALSLIGAGRVILSQSVTIVGALAHYSYFSMAYGQIAASLFSVIAWNMIGRKHASFRLTTRHLRRITHFGVQMLAISGVNSIAIRLSEAALGRIVGLSALGLYARASNLNNIAWENIHIIIGRVVFVKLAEEKRSGRPLRDSYLRVIEIMTALMWPAFIGLAIVSGPFIRAIYGERWVGAAHPLAILALAAVLLVSISMTWELFVISQQTGKQAKIEIARSAIGLAAFVAMSFAGLTAAAGARILEAGLSIWLYRPHLNRMSDTRTADFVPDLPDELDPHRACYGARGSTHVSLWWFRAHTADVGRRRGRGGRPLVGRGALSVQTPASHRSPQPFGPR